MCRILAVLLCCLSIASASIADDDVFPDGRSVNFPGGLVIVRKGNQTTWAAGGVLVPRAVKVVTRTPDGKEYAKFKLPSVLHSPTLVPLPTSAPGILQVSVPDRHALVFVEGELVRTTGTTRQLESPALPPGSSVFVRVRAAYVVGDKFVIEDKDVLLRAGSSTPIAFDGSRAVIVSLPMNTDQLGKR